MMDAGQRLDLDGDGVEESTVTDANSDGVVDTLAADLDGDGIDDLFVADTDFDGYADSIVSDYEAEVADADVELAGEGEGTEGGDAGATEATYYGDDGNAVFSNSDGFVSASGTTVGGDGVSFDPEMGAVVTPAIIPPYDPGFDADF
jgi:hypothetical protein